MSLWFPLMVNDEKIGSVEIKRTHTKPDGNHTYVWTVRPDNHPHGTKFSSVLQHQESDGAFELVRKVLNAYANCGIVANITAAGYEAMREIRQ